MKKSPFTGGIILAASIFYQNTGDDTAVIDMLTACGLKPAEIKREGEPYDVDKLEPLFPQLRERFKR